jgi:hypothetical protein
MSDPAASLLPPLGGEVLRDHHERSRQEVFVDWVTTYIARDEHSPLTACVLMCPWLTATCHLVILGCFLGSMRSAFFSSADTECGAAISDQWSAVRYRCTASIPFQVVPAHPARAVVRASDSRSAKRSAIA